MLRVFKTPEKRLGSAPGTLHEESADFGFLAACTSYNEDVFEHSSCDTVEACIDAIGREGTINWLNVTGDAIHGVLREIGRKLNVHDLVLEDIQNASQPLKFEEYDNFVFIVVKSLMYSHIREDFIIADTKILVGENYVITFSAEPVPMYLKLFKRLSQKNTKLRKLGVPYLLFALLDALSDGSYETLNRIIDIMEDLEGTVQENFQDFDVAEIYRIKQLMGHAKRSLWRYMEIINSIKVSDYMDIPDDVLPYYKDLEDHYKHMRDIVESVHATATDMFNLYVSLNGQQMNEVMKVLTIFSAIFIPLTFIAGLYGMNFQNMPELAKPWGYPAVLGLMTAVAGAMLVYFRRKKWF
ncbi:magnesium/cobalt transporter CorA [Geovibrio sp. ADMFC3]